MKTVRLIGLLALLLGSTPLLWAQLSESLPLPSVDNEPPHRTEVKFAPFSLFDPDNTIQFGIERLLGQHHGLQLELGYGWQSMNLWQTSQDNQYNHREIWRGRAEWRYYFTKTNQPLGRYIAFEVFHKQVNVRESGTVGIGCATGPCQYYQMFSSPLQKYVWGGHVKFGRQLSLLPNSNRLLADFYMGLGIRWRSIERFQPPTNAYYYRYNDYNVFDEFSSTRHALISIAYGAKIGWAF